MLLEEWHLPVEQIIHLFKEANVLEYIEKCYGIFHCEGDEAVLEDITEFLEGKRIEISAWADCFKDEKTKLWCNGPAYIAELYMEKLEKSWHGMWVRQRCPARICDKEDEGGGSSKNALKEAMVGYPDPCYFSRVFKEQTNQYPKEYRQSQSET